MLFYGEVDVVSLGSSNNFTAEKVSVLLEPLGSNSSCELAISNSLETSCSTALLLNFDNIANLYKIGRNVYFLAVYCEVSVVNELTSFSSCSSKTESVNNVVKSCLNVCEKCLTCLTL